MSDISNQEPTKICSKCKVEKPVSQFYKDKRNKDGFKYACKNCNKKYNKKNLTNYYSRNKEKINLQQKEYRLRNKERINRLQRQYYLENQNKCKLFSRKYWRKNKKSNSLRNKQYSIKHKDKIRNYKKQYWLNNKNKTIIKNKQYRLTHKQELREQKRIYEKQKRNGDPNYKISCNCRNRIRLAIRNNWKANRTSALIGCSVPELKLHIEKQWQIGMNWKNWGYGNDKWHIDHIIPCAFFDMSDPVEQYMCFNYSNLQPLWQQDNIKKSDKIL